jgi:hypothetical protein
MDGLPEDFGVESDLGCEKQKRVRGKKGLGAFAAARSSHSGKHPVASGDTKDVLRRFDSETGWLAAGLVSFAIITALALAGQEWCQLATDRVTEEKLAGDDGLLKANPSALPDVRSVNAESASTEKPSGQPVSIDRTGSVMSASRRKGDSPPPKAGLTFTRFGLWERENRSPTLLDQQGSQDAPSTSPTVRSGSVTPSPPDSASVSSGQGYLTQIINLAQGPGRKKRSKGHHGTSRASDGSRFAKIKIRVEPGERLLATRPERRDEQDASQTPQIADLPTKQNTALEAELRNAQEDTQQAQRIADLATGQRSALEAQLRKAQEENAQLVQHDADIAAFYKSDANYQCRKDQGNVQAVQEDANLATNKPEPGQIQPPISGQNENPPASTQPLDPPGQPTRP